MRITFPLIFSLILSIVFLSSCERKESPYPLPDPGNAQFEKLDIGDHYEFHLFYSFTDGLISKDSFTVWDICFNQSSNKFEMWLNGGKGNLIYKTNTEDFSKTDFTVNISNWAYDAPTWEENTSAYGIIENGDINKVWLVKVNDITYKFQFLNIEASAGITIRAGKVTDTEGQVYNLDYNPNFSFLYFSFTDGPMQIEPPKEKWDVWFVRYRHIFYGENPDGSDMPYFVNGVLLNPYQTQAAADTLTPRNFDTLGLEAALNEYTFTTRRNIIGYHWKEVNINNGEYTVLPERVYLVKDAEERLWKLHFVNFYDENGQRGKPQFEFKRLQ